MRCLNMKFEDCNREDKLAKLYIYHSKLGKLVMKDISFAPFFLKIEQEIKAYEDTNDLLSRARRAAGQKAIA